MYVDQANACGLDNSSTPMSPAAIADQDARIAAVGRKFTDGNAAMGAIISRLTPPVATGVCDDFTSSDSMVNESPFPWPLPEGMTLAPGSAVGGGSWPALGVGASGAGVAGPGPSGSAGGSIASSPGPSQPGVTTDVPGDASNAAARRNWRRWPGRPGGGGRWPAGAPGALPGDGFAYGRPGGGGNPSNRLPVIYVPSDRSSTIDNAQGYAGPGGGYAYGGPASGGPWVLPVRNGGRAGSAAGPGGLPPAAWPYWTSAVGPSAYPWVGVQRIAQNLIPGLLCPPGGPGSPASSSPVQAAIAAAASSPGFWALLIGGAALVWAASSQDKKKEPAAA